MYTKQLRIAVLAERLPQRAETFDQFARQTPYFECGEGKREARQRLFLTG